MDLDTLRATVKRTARGVSMFFPLVLAAVVVGAALFTLTLGNPLGRPTGVAQFPHQARSGQVTVESTVRDEGLIEIADWADGYLAALGKRFAAPTPPITVRLLESRAAFERFGERRIPGFHGGMDFCYNPVDRAIYAWHDRSHSFRPRLRHELFHALAHGTHLGTWPLWVEEGVAELCEDLDLDERGTLSLDGIQSDRLRTAGRHALRTNALDTRSLAARGHAAFTGPDRNLSYSLAYSVALLLEREGRLVEALSSGFLLVDRERYRAFVTDPGAWRQPQPAPDRPSTLLAASSDRLAHLRLADR